MKDAWLGKPVIDQLRHAIPCETALLTAPPERSPPEVGYMMSERRKRPAIGRHRIVGEVAGYDLPQPSPLLGIGWCIRRRSSALTSFSLVSMRSRRVFR
jgi:hypothetical protein